MHPGGSWLAHGPAAAAESRRYAAEQLAGCAAELVQDVELVVTELVTNAVLHGRPPVLVTVTPQEHAARVEVCDTGSRQVVLPVPSAEAMTGRGLSLVAALSRSWGVEPLTDGGKRIWALVDPTAPAAAAAPELDVSQFLDAWDDEPDDVRYSVDLGAVSTKLLLEAKRHIDNVVRELTLASADSAVPPPPELQALVRAVTVDFALARAGIKELAAAAAARGEPQTRLVLRLPASSISGGERYLAALEEVDRYARNAQLLTLEPPPLHRLFRRWYVTAVVEQLRQLTQGVPVVPARPFLDVLIEELDELSGLRDAAHRLDLLQRVNAALTRTDSADGLAEAVLSAAVQELGAVTARVYVAEGRVLRAIGQRIAPHAGVSGYDELDVEADLPGSLVFRTGKPWVARSTAQLTERFPALADVYDSDRVLHVVPLSVGAHRLGVLALGFPPAGRYDEPAQTQFVRALADALAQGLERIDAAHRVRSRAPETLTSPAPDFGPAVDGSLRDLASAAASIAGAGSVDALLRAVAHAAAAVLGAESATAVRSHPTAPDQVVTYPASPGAVPPEHSGASVLSAPFLNRHGDHLGYVAVDAKRDGTGFDGSDVVLLGQLSALVTAALEHLEISAELQQTLSRLRQEQQVSAALHDVGRAVTARLDHADVVQVVTDAATALTGAQFGAFFYNVLDDHGESYALYTISGVEAAAFAQFPMPRNTAVFAPTFAGEATLRLDDVTADARYGRSGPHWGMPAGHLPVRSYLAVPVRLADGTVAGGLFFGHAEPAVFGADAERIAEGIATYAAIALDNGRLYDEARRQSRARQDVAAALERPLVPPPLPEVPGLDVAARYEPFLRDSAVGGDFYDLFPLPGARWVLALGDVAGKGPEAAALTGLARHTLWGAAQHAPSASAIAEVVNAALVRQGSDRFATLVIAVLQPDDHGFAVEAVWAGHPSGTLVRGGEVLSVHGDGLPLGLFPDSAAGPVRFRLEPGDTLVLHTDGLTERRGAVLSDDEVQQLVARYAALPVQDMLQALTEAISERHPARDDVAVLGLRASVLAPSIR